MNDAQSPTKLSDESTAEPTSVDLPLDSHPPGRVDGETLPLDSPEVTHAFDGSSPVGPVLEPTVAFSTDEVPPGSSETLNLGTEATVEIPRWAATTELAPSSRQVDDGETIDSHHGDGTTEVADLSGRMSPKPSARQAARLRGAPTLPGYTLQTEIGRGGMGVVYKAWHNRLQRHVALKMILAGVHASGEQLERFQIEAQSVAQIQYHGIVQIYDVGEHEGLPYFSLEFVAGGSLDRKIGGKPQPPIEAATMVRKLALAMHEAHSRKIIHRDLKPANVLLTPEGEPKITDFGLAKRMEDDSHQTRSGAIMGTPSYMAPEQAWGLTHEIGPHTDQYALGAILYEMLVGHVPFQGASALETLELARTQEPVAPRRLQPRIPVDLETICLKCLQKEASKRYDDVKTLADELDRFLTGQPIQARPIGRVERAGRWCKRNPKVAGLIATVAVLMIALTVGSTAFALRLSALNTDLVKSNKAELIAKEAAQEKEILANLARNEAIRAQALTEDARKKEAEQRAKAIAELERARKAVKGATAQNRNALEAQRIMSVLILQRLAPIPGTLEIREELIKTAMTGLRNYVSTMNELSSVFEDTEGQLLMKRTLAGINQRAGRIAEEYERYDDTVKYFEAMNRMAEELIALAPGDTNLMTVLAVSKATLGGFELDRLGDGKAALDLFEQALKIRQAILERLPGNDDAKLGVSNVLGAIARCHLKLGDPLKAREIYREEATLRDRLGPQIRELVATRSERAGLEEKLGDVCLDLNDHEGARTAYNRSLEFREQIVKDHPNEIQAKRDVILSVRKIATLDLFVRQPELALEGYSKALEFFRSGLKADPNGLRTKQDVSVTEYYVATACLRLKKLDDARTHYRACLEIRRSLSSDPRAKLNLIDLMIARARCGEYEEASATARELCSKPPLDPRIYYQAACGFSLSAGAVAELPASAEHKKRLIEYTEAAVKALRQAKEVGWRNLGDLRNDPDLDPIRDNPAFAAILQEFQESVGR